MSEEPGDNFRRQNILGGRVKRGMAKKRSPLKGKPRSVPITWKVGRPTKQGGMKGKKVSISIPVDCYVDAIESGHISRFFTALYYLVAKDKLVLADLKSDVLHDRLKKENPNGPAT